MATSSNPTHGTPIAAATAADNCSDDHCLRHLSGLLSGQVAAVVERLRSELEQSRIRFLTEQRELLAQAYKIAFVARQDSDCWLDFCRMAKWADARPRPSLERAEEALKYVLVSVLETSGKSGKSRANDALLALSEAWEQAVSPSQIAELLRQRGGVRRMALRVRSRRRKVAMSRQRAA